MGRQLHVSSFHDVPANWWVPVSPVCTDRDRWSNQLLLDDSWPCLPNKTQELITTINFTISGTLRNMKKIEQALEMLNKVMELEEDD